MSEKFTSFADVDRLLAGWSAGAKRHTYSLDHMHKLLACVGNPQQKLRVIHIAGTSGKTSTAYYVAALLQAAGQRVGLTVSPHVDTVSERVQIDLVPMPEAAFCQRLGEFVELIKPCGVVPNYFELFISFAFWEFAARQLDYAVVEVGIGGLLDSTNVIDRQDKVCVVTDIGFDHMKLLGTTLPEIAEQKAGIIQLHNAVFAYRQSDEVTEVIRVVARQKQGDLHLLTDADQASELAFLPLFQQRNFGLARAVAQFVQERDELPTLSKKSLESAAHTTVPCRMETSKLGGKTLILDVAHNAQKFQALFASVSAQYPGQPIAVLVRGRTPRADMVMEGLHGASHIIFTSLAEGGDKPDKNFSPDQFAASCHKAGYDSFEIIADPKAAFAALRARPEPILVVTGSFYLLNHIRPLLSNVL